VISDPSLITAEINSTYTLVHEASIDTWKFQRLGLVLEFSQGSAWPGPLCIVEVFIRMAQQTASSSHSAFHFEANNVSDWFEWLTHIQLCDQLREGWFGSFYFPPGEREALHKMYPESKSIGSVKRLGVLIARSSHKLSNPTMSKLSLNKSSLHKQQTELMRQSADTVSNALHTWLRLRDAGGDLQATFKTKVFLHRPTELPQDIRASLMHYSASFFLLFFSFTFYQLFFVSFNPSTIVF
jgi:hypothetical protein